MPKKLSNSKAVVKEISSSDDDDEYDEDFDAEGEVVEDEDEDDEDDESVDEWSFKLVIVSDFDATGSCWAGVDEEIEGKNDDEDGEDAEPIPAPKKPVVKKKVVVGKK